MDKQSITLSEKQALALEKCKENKRYGVFFDMGVGKTATMLSLIDYLAFETLEVSKILIIAPATVVNKAKVWQKEIQKWKNYDFMDYVEFNKKKDKRKQQVEENSNTIALMSDSLITWYKETFKNLHNFDMIIIDESSRFKSPKSQRFKALSKMIEDKHRVYLLSGTPMPNGFQDLWSQMYLLDKGERMESNYYRFINKYARYVNEYKFVFKAGVKQLLTSKVEDICIFAEGNVEELPEKEEHLVELDWGETKNKKFKEFKKNYILELGDKEITALSITAMLNKSLQLSNGGIYVDRDLRYEIFDNSKLNWVYKFSKTARDNMLVFYSFKFDKERLLKIPNTREIKTDKDVDDWNEGKIKIGIISPYSFQYGANLQYGGSIVVWYGLQWGLENYLQSNKRIWRRGQKNKVDIYYLMMKNTDDILVYKRLVSKEIEENEFLERIKMVD